MIAKQAILSVVLFSIFAFPALCLGFGSGIETCDSPVQPVALVSPKLITQCDAAGIQAALNGGGHVRFECGGSPVTIPITSELQISTEADTVIDGGGLVTLDGQNASRIFHKGWHDPANTIAVTLQNIRLINGRGPGGSEDSGGAFRAGHVGTSVYLIDSTFENNATADQTTPDNQGGAVFVHNATETVISGCEFVGNTAGNGGAFGGIATGLFVFNSHFSQNEASDESSGGIVRGHGGAIHLDGVTNAGNPDSNNRVQVCGSVFEDNRSVRGGGALKVTVSDNLGTRAIYEKSTFARNAASGASGVEGHGGAIYHIEDDQTGGNSERNVEILDCAFQENQGWKQGGGAWISVLGEVEVINSTFAENTVSQTEEFGMGGGLALNQGTVGVVNATFARNFAAFHGGGIQAANGATVTLRNTLFFWNESTRDWGNYQMNRAADADGGGNLQYPGERFNQSGSPTDQKVTPTVLIADPLLADLADNGGPTATMALGAGSPAVDAGVDAGAPPSDQRGVARDASPDIGAYEVSGDGPAITLEDVIVILRICADVDISPGPSITDISGDGRIGLPEAVHGLRRVAGF